MNEPINKQWCSNMHELFTCEMGSRHDNRGAFSLQKNASDELVVNVVAGGRCPRHLSAPKQSDNHPLLAN